MSVREILIWPEISLSRKSHSVDCIDSNVVSLVGDMVDTMKESGGIGLAAPQIGLNKQIFIIDMEKVSTLEKIECTDPILVAINPRIVDGFGELTIQEGCLSIPDELFFVQRSPFIMREYQGLDGHQVTQSFNGLASIAIQHEIDHLEGILLIDNVNRERKQKILENMSVKKDCEDLSVGEVWRPL